MTISESEFQVMANIGAQTTSKDTYAILRNALEHSDARYSLVKPKIFLQGSYANHTNIYKESDVDIVILLETAFSYDLAKVSDTQKIQFHQIYPATAEYGYSAFRNDVIDHLLDRFGSDVRVGSKAIKIKSNGSRRDADILIAIKHRKYISFDVLNKTNYVEGISFYRNNGGERIVNFPELHKTFLSQKNQDTKEILKPSIRIFKNIRQKLLDKKIINPGSAPSYFIEGMLSNIPSELFLESTYGGVIANCINWLQRVDPAILKCGHQQSPLLNSGSDVSWNEKEFEKFIYGAKYLLSR